MSGKRILEFPHCAGKASGRGWGQVSLGIFENYCYQEKMNPKEFHQKWMIAELLGSFSVDIYKTESTVSVLLTSTKLRPLSQSPAAVPFIFQSWRGFHSAIVNTFKNLSDEYLWSRRRLNGVFSVCLRRTLLTDTSHNCNVGLEQLVFPLEIFHMYLQAFEQFSWGGGRRKEMWLLLTTTKKLLLNCWELLPPLLLVNLLQLLSSQSHQNNWWALVKCFE